MIFVVKKSLVSDADNMLMNNPPKALDMYEDIVKIKNNGQEITLYNNLYSINSELKKIKEAKFYLDKLIKQKIVELYQNTKNKIYIDGKGFRQTIIGRVTNEAGEAVDDIRNNIDRRVEFKIYDSNYDMSKHSKTKDRDKVCKSKAQWH